MKKKTKKATTNLPKEKKNEKLSKIKLYQCLYLEEKEADEEKNTTKISIKNKNKPQKKKQKGKENDNLEEDVNAIDSDYAYFISTINEPRDISFKILLKCNELPQFKNLCVGHAQDFRRGLQYHLALPIEFVLKEN